MVKFQDQLILSKLLVSEVSQGQLIRMHGKTSDEFQNTESLVGSKYTIGGHWN